jgi:cell division protein ZapA (FtsZ GTPase activity inhibitor)
MTYRSRASLARPVPRRITHLGCRTPYMAWIRALYMVAVQGWPYLGATAQEVKR